MYKSTLIKQHHDYHIAHLYEHLFAMHLSSCMRSKELYSLLDYDFVAKTYYGGIIYLEISLYSQKAKKEYLDILSAPTKINDSNLEISLKQISAEYEQSIAVDQKNTLLALSKLDAVRWEDLNQFTYANQKQNKRDHTSLVKLGNKHLVRPLRFDIILDSTWDKYNKYYLPLFRVLAIFLQSNLSEDLSNKYGFFSSADNFVNSKNKIFLRNIFTVSHQHESQLIDEADFVEQSLKTISKIDKFNALIEILQNVTYSQGDTGAPDFERTMEDTDIFIGGKGWRKIANPSVLKDLIKHTSIQITYKKTSRKINLREV